MAAREGAGAGRTDAASPGLPRRMQKKERGFSIAAAARALQANVNQAGPAAGAGYTLIGSIILLGGAGYLLDGWLDTAPWLLFTGLGLGIVVGFYELVKMTRPR